MVNTTGPIKTSLMNKRKRKKEDEERRKDDTEQEQAKQKEIEENQRKHARLMAKIAQYHSDVAAGLNPEYPTINDIP